MDSALFAPVIRLTTYAPLFGALFLLSHPSIITEIPNLGEHPKVTMEAQLLELDAATRDYFYASPPTNRWALLNEDAVQQARGEEEQVRNRETYQALTFIAVEILICFKQLLHLADTATASYHARKSGKTEWQKLASDITVVAPSILVPLIVFYVLPMLVVDKRWSWEASGVHCPPALLRNVTTYTELKDNGSSGTNHERFLWVLRRLPLVLHPMLHVVVCTWSNVFLPDGLHDQSALSTERLPKPGAMIVLTVLLVAFGLVGRYMALSGLENTPDIAPLLNTSTMAVWILGCLFFLNQWLSPSNSDSDETVSFTAVKLLKRSVFVAQCCGLVASATTVFVTLSITVLDNTLEQPVDPALHFALSQVGESNIEFLSQEPVDLDINMLEHLVEQQRSWIPPLVRASHHPADGSAKLLKMQTIVAHSQERRKLNEFAKSFNSAAGSRLHGVDNLDTKIQASLSVQRAKGSKGHLVLTYSWDGGNGTFGVPSTTPCGNQQVMHATLGKGLVLVTWDRVPELVWKGYQTLKLDVTLLGVAGAILLCFTVRLEDGQSPSAFVDEDHSFQHSQTVQRKGKSLVKRTSMPTDVEAVRWQRLAEAHGEDRNKREVKAFLDDPTVDEKTREYLAETFTTIPKPMHGKLSIAMITSMHIKLNGVRKKLRRESTRKEQPEVSKPTDEGSEAVPRVLSDTQNVDVSMLNTWEFDPTNLTMEQLVSYGTVLLKLPLITNAFAVSDKRIVNFVTALSTKYIASNPYHNFAHGIDVAQFVYNTIQTTDAALWLEPVDILAAIVAALAHDVGHPGVSNKYLVLSQGELAVTYNDKSPLENMHASTLFTLLQNDDCNILNCLSDGQMIEARNVIINAILGTDMVFHFETISKLQVLQQDYMQFSRERSDHIVPLCIEGPTNPLRLEYLKGDPNSNRLGHRVSLVEALLHTADIGNALRPQSISVKWSQRVMEEFYKQGDAEREAGLPLSPFFSRDSNVPLVQFNFIEYIVSPLCIEVIKLFPSCNQLGKNMIDNLTYWGQELISEPNKLEHGQIDVENTCKKLEALRDEVFKIQQETKTYKH